MILLTQAEKGKEPGSRRESNPDHWLEPPVLDVGGRSSVVRVIISGYTVVATASFQIRTSGIHLHTLHF